jgi:biopolymer transport protein ExbB
MKKIVIILSLILFGSTVCGENLDLDQLLKKVKQAQSREGKTNKQREAKFLSEKNQQQKLLANAKAKLQQQQRLSDQLRMQLESNEQILSELETELDKRSGVLGELFGVAKQVAGDLKADLENSLVSEQYPNRTKQLAGLVNSKTLPTIEQLETLWFTLQQEMTESGKVVRYPTKILTTSGEPKNSDVIRIGVFNALSEEGKYLRYLPETAKLVELARQPESRYLSLAEDFVNTSSGIADVAIDPTRGVILSLLIQTPNVFERIQQGGIIGYIILALGVIGLVYGIWRLIVLTITGTKMQQQMQSQEPDTSNPLGRVIAAAQQKGVEDAETFELLLDEAITKEIPQLEKGQTTIKLLASVAPLLGLLGTVTGMIATFQSISLFGTGDPKLMASGISQALVTTMLGLMVAIPLLFLHSLVASRSRTLIQILDEQSAGLISKRLEK